MILPLKWKSAAPSLQNDSRNVPMTFKCGNFLFAMGIFIEMGNITAAKLPWHSHILNIEIAVFVLFRM